MADYGQSSSLEVTLAGPFTSSGGSGGKYSSVTLSASGWKNAESPFQQTVAVDGISKTSRVEIVSTAEQIALLESQSCAVCAVNVSGTVTFYAVGSCPTVDLTLGVILEDVSGADGTICGNTVGAPLTHVTEISEAVAAASAVADAALPKTGGTLTGALTVNGLILTSADYGSTLPESGVTGQIFLKKVE